MSSSDQQWIRIGAAVIRSIGVVANMRICSRSGSSRIQLLHRMSPCVVAVAVAVACVTVYRGSGSGNGNDNGSGSGSANSLIQLSQRSVCEPQKGIRAAGACRSCHSMLCLDASLQPCEA